MTIETVRISRQGRDQLSRLKSRTGIGQWNVLCRWALCLSLMEPGCPPASKSGDRPIEMTWRTFGGDNADIYLALIRIRCLRDGLDLADHTIADQLHAHIHRGISYLAGDPEVKAISGLTNKVVMDSFDKRRKTG